LFPIEEENIKAENRLKKVFLFSILFGFLLSVAITATNEIFQEQLLEKLVKKVLFSGAMQVEFKRSDDSKNSIMYVKAFYENKEATYYSIKQIRGMEISIFFVPSFFIFFIFGIIFYENKKKTYNRQEVVNQEASDIPQKRELTEEQLQEITNLIKENKKINAIAKYKEFSGVSLKEAKDFIESI